MGSPRATEPEGDGHAGMHPETHQGVPCRPHGSADAALLPHARVLEKDPGQRLSMAAALAHPWISAGASAAPSTLLSSVVVARLQSFTRTSRLERLLLNLAANQLTSKEIDRLGAMFRALDHDDDGCAPHCLGFRV